LSKYEIILKINDNMFISHLFCDLPWVWFSPGTAVSSTNKTDCPDITEILLKVELNTIILTHTYDLMQIIKKTTIILTLTTAIGLFYF
jgi:hypothetical protein